MIVKIQQSLGGNTDQDHILIYDESREFMSQLDEPEFVQEIQTLMGDRPKIYAEVELSKSGMLSITDVLDPQPW